LEVKIIPAIASMIGAYIFTRMVQILIPTDKEGKTSPVVFFLAVITILITIYSVISIFEAGASIPNY